MQYTVTPEQKALIQLTFRSILKNPDRFVETFYTQFFTRLPPARALFKHSIKEQGEKLMEILTLVVSSLDTPALVLPAVSALGRRHIHYGVQREYYDFLGLALIDTLRIELGDQFTPEAETAWRGVYAMISSIAIRASYEN